MTPYRRGDIVLLPFPFTDLTTIKQRPAIAISAEEFNESGADIIVCAITSQMAGGLSPYEYKLSDNELRNGGLPKPSKVKCGKIIAIDSRLVRRKLGTISSNTLIEILRIIGKILQ